MVTFNADSEWRGPTLPIHLARLPVVRSRRRLYQSYFPVFCEFHASDDNTGIGGAASTARRTSVFRNRHLAFGISPHPPVTDCLLTACARAHDGPHPSLAQRRVGLADEYPQHRPRIEIFDESQTACDRLRKTQGRLFTDRPRNSHDDVGIVRSGFFETSPAAGLFAVLRASDQNIIHGQVAQMDAKTKTPGCEAPGAMIRIGMFVPQKVSKVKKIRPEKIRKRYCCHSNDSASIFRQRQNSLPMLCSCAIASFQTRHRPPASSG